jgi:structural maintenance of chromosome 1
VPLGQYTQELEKIRLFIKAKNFLVLQGQVEQISMRNPKERTTLFEEISELVLKCSFQKFKNVCRSGKLKADYDRLKAEYQKAEDDTAFNYNKRRGIALEKREARMEKEEAERFQQLKAQLEAKNIQLYLCQLYHSEVEQDKCAEEITTKKDAIEKVSACFDGVCVF